jgi:hypothetical protein
MLTIPISPSRWFAYGKAAVLLAVAASIFAGGYALRDHYADQQAADFNLQISELKGRHADERENAVNLALAAEREARAAEQLLNQRVQEPASEDRKIKAPIRRAAAARVSDAAAELRNAAEGLNAADAAQATGDPVDTQRSETTTAAELVQARQLLSQCSQLLAELAIFADAAHAAGLVCERSWDAMSE